VKRLGSGGNGNVWLATDYDGRTAAVKVLKKKFQRATDNRYKRFLDEARIHIVWELGPVSFPSWASISQTSRGRRTRHGWPRRWGKKSGVLSELPLGLRKS